VAYPTDGLVVWEINDSANADDANGGAYYADGTAGSVDKSQGAAIVRNDLVIGATTTEVTSAGTPFTASDVNNLINITGGAGFTTGRRRIVSVAAGVATLSSSAGTAASTGGTSRLGGPMRTLGLCAAAISAITGTHNTVWVTGQHTMSSETANVANGRPVFPSGTVVRGYHAVRGDSVLSSTMLPNINRTVAGASNILEMTTGNNSFVSNIRFTGTAGRSGIGGGVTVYCCWIDSSELNTNSCRFQSCVILNNFSVYSSGTDRFDQCYLRCSYNINSCGIYTNCLITIASGGTFWPSDEQLVMSNCTIVIHNTVLVKGTGTAVFNRCVWYSVTSAGTINGNAIHPQKVLMNECAYNVAPTNVTNVSGALYSGDPFVNRAGLDFELTPALYATLAATTSVPGLATTPFPRTIGAVPATTSGGGGAPMIGSRIGKAA
jgi:hypothetical protein